MTQRSFERPGEMTLEAPVTRLDVNLVAGRLNVVGTDGPARIEVTAVGRRPVLVDLVDGRLWVRHQQPESWTGYLWWIGGFNRAFRADVSIAVPHGTVSDLRLVSGPVVASSLRNRTGVNVTSGRVSLLGLGGDVDVKTISGPVDALGVDGDLAVETVSGEITVADTVPRRLSARAISGSVTCDLDNSSDSRIRLDTTSGEITVRVREDSDLEVSLRATSGRVSSAFPQLPVNRGHGPGNSVSGRLGTGAGRLDVSAISGNISLLARAVDDEEPPEDEPVVAPPRAPSPEGGVK